MQDVNAYLNGPFDTIDGWCDPFLWQVLAPLHDAQEALGASGPVAEIGVHHGKLLIGLMKTKGKAAGNLAIDAFDLQQFNLDGSGEGSMEKLQANLARCGLGADALRCVRADSLALGAADVPDLRRDAPEGFALVSVDGGHEVEYALGDIRLAMELAMPQGIILVDDFFAPDWPGVTEALARLYLHDRPRFVPLLAGYNKLLLCHRSYHATFARALVEHIQARLASRVNAKRVTLFGYRVLAMHPDRSLPFDGLDDPPS